VEEWDRTNLKPDTQGMYLYSVIQIYANGGESTLILKISQATSGIVTALKTSQTEARHLVVTE
jgi:hypothetical protein